MTGVLNISKQFVFIHVPKCAGTSIANKLLSIEGSVAFNRLDELKALVDRDNAGSDEILNNVGHARARQIREFVGADVYAGLRSVAVVRDPWARLVSRYSYLRRTAKPPVPPHLAGPFEGFVTWACRHKKATMLDRLGDQDGRLLVTDILRFENLEAEFLSVARDLTGADIELPRMNISAERSAPPEVSQKVVDLVQRTYAEDFRVFGYAPDLPDWMHLC